MRLVTLVEQGERAVVGGRAGLGELEHRAPAAVFGVRGRARVGVAGFVEVELAEVRTRPELSVLRSLERGRASLLRRRIRIERQSAGVGRGVVDRHPVSVEGLAVGVQILGVLAEGVAVGVRGVDRLERDRLTGTRRDHLQGLQLATLGEVAGVHWHEAVDEAVRELGERARNRRATDVLDDPQVTGGVVLDSLVAAATQAGGDVLDLRADVRRGLPDTAVGTQLGGEQQPLRPRVPGGTVDVREGLTRDVRRGEQGHPVGRVRVEVDAGDVAGLTDFVTLEQEVRPVVVTRVGAVLTGQPQVGVLVRLGLGGLDVVRRALHVARGRQQVRRVAVVTVVGH